MDIVYHFPEWSNKNDLHPYLGFGQRLKIRPEQEAGQFRFGIRFGIGVEYVRGPFGLYSEIYPGMDILPDAAFCLEGGIGVRYYFSI
jgi:hypothetical protein